ncbi:DUF1998 domain-containing protein [Amycolatopsis rhizosphaerae]|uniref:DUF1998 domain-containing protein n=1 Tax=Amycolatopsis rhizosphaerae TaxID=2053003 RepID=A0A558D5R9_9PSEU|nr:DUF1998 domain-containing protein [Amycolatopsis rhizosphaerae]TVT56350.1 DUF1998 domain-containing protein [Amycolatopsis rhizosphaerae]
MADLYRRRVGAVRPSHLMFTSGVGSLVDLPNFSVLVRGLDDWNYHAIPDYQPIAEPRLLSAVQGLLGKGISQLRPAPWLPGLDKDVNSAASRVGVPTTPFPAWFRCTACNELAALDGPAFGFENDNAHRPHDARFYHKNCARKKRRPLAVPARFVLACTAGHLDEFPYVHFVHRGAGCTKASHPRLRMDDRGGNLGANVEIQCINCGERRNIREASGRRGAENLPRCRGRHPHLDRFDPLGCPRQEPPKMLVVGASNQWFAQTLSALHVPRTEASELQTLVEQHWTALATLPMAMYVYGREHVPAFKHLAKWTDEEIAAAVERHRATLGEGQQAETGYPDLRAAEWEIFSTVPTPEPHEDFTLRRDPSGIPVPLKEIYSDIVQAERLREVRALVGFTRLDAPDPEDPDLVTSAPLAKTPSWVPASEVRGEGIFLRVPEDLLSAWEERVADSPQLAEHHQAYGRFRENRFSDRISGPFDRMKNWPGPRYLALHTLSHLLIRTIALECGYSSASLSERIYAGNADDPRGGILIYTAVPDAEGTLGGLVSLAEPDSLIRLTRRALTDARHCSSDPLCAERLPQKPADFLHGAACHVCLFVSETTCERGNRFLDRRFIVPIDDPALALFPEIP